VIQTQAADSVRSSDVRRPRIEPGALFARWFWLVYVPLVLFAGLLGLAFGSLLPRWGMAALLVTSLWAAAAVRLLAERLRLGVEVPLPKNLVGGITWIVGLGTTGGVFIWIGLSKLTSEAGMILALAGIFFIAFAVMLPLMKAVDAIFRMAGRRVARAFAPRPARTRQTRPARARQTRPARARQTPLPRAKQPQSARAEQSLTVTSRKILAAPHKPSPVRRSAPAAKATRPVPRRKPEVELERERDEIRVTSAASRG
jgi:hypothetical protein